MKVGYSKSAAATPAFALIAEGWNELVQEGMTPDLRGDSPVAWTQQVLFYAREDEIVGVLCFSHDDVCNAYVLSLAYVEPTSRRQGVFRVLWQELVKRASEAGVSRVMANIHESNNVAMAAMYTGAGATLVSRTYELLTGA